MASLPEPNQIDLNDPKGAVKAAIFLLAMGEEFSAEVFKHLQEEEVRRVSRLMAQIQTIPGEAVEKVMEEVQEKMGVVQGGVAVPVEEFLRKVLFSSMATEQAEKIYQEIVRQLHPSTFQKLSHLEPKAIVGFLRNEHPQTIAVILAHLDSLQTASILRELPENLQADIMMRIASLDKISPDIVAEIDRVLEEELFSVEMSDAKKVGGVAKVADILNNLERPLEDALIEKIEAVSEPLAEEIKKLMFKFEDLLGVEDSSVILILKEVSMEELKYSLKVASDELKAKFFKNMSERAGGLLREELEIMGPVRLREVEKNQQAILKVAKRLESEGKIVLSAKGGEEVLV